MNTLELKHIAPYLPYDVKFAMLNDDDNTYYIDKERNTLECGGINGVSNILMAKYSRPIYMLILRPLSELFNGNYEFILDEFSEVSLNHFKTAFFCELRPLNAFDFINYTISLLLFKHHFDVFGLIEKGLAIDINTINQ